MNIKKLKSFIQTQVAYYALTVPFSLRQAKIRVKKVTGHLTLEGLAKVSLSSTFLSPIPAYAVQNAPLDLQNIPTSLQQLHNPRYDSPSTNNIIKEYTAEPGLGYVLIPENPDCISSLEGILQSKVDVERIGLLDRLGVYVVHNGIGNEKIINILRTYQQIIYAAPLYSVKGETVAIIPEIVVKASLGTTLEELQTLCESMGLEITKRIDYTDNEYLLRVLGRSEVDVFYGVEQLKTSQYIEWASPNRAFKPTLCGQVIPNDPLFARQWHLNNINAPEAWEITRGDSDITIAVLDNGVDTNHPDLPNIKIVAGSDLYGNDNQPDPAADGHGTAIAGIIAAKGNNLEGVVGVSWNSTIMPIRISSYENFVT